MALEKTPDEHPNADLVRRAHQSFKSGDPDAWREFFAEDILWTVTGEGEASGVTRGFSGVMKNFGAIMEWTNGTYNAIPVDYLGTDDFAFAMARATATRPDGRELDVPEYVAFKVRDGKLVEAMHVALDEEAWDAFFAPAPVEVATAP